MILTLEGGGQVKFRKTTVMVKKIEDVANMDCTIGFSVLRIGDRVKSQTNHAICD